MDQLPELLRQVCLRSMSPHTLFSYETLNLELYADGLNPRATLSAFNQLNHKFYEMTTLPSSPTRSISDLRHIKFLIQT